ncbi:hypothetical protein HYU11_03060 [Candidatus Woesearchaeota archaeon]|nr:hypothetical protein [Candidatus Woesearchaeota archaeon]
MGRYKDFKQEATKPILSASEDLAFLQYFEGWKTNNQVTENLKEKKKFKVRSKKPIKSVSSSVGRHSKKFKRKGWLECQQMELEQVYKNKNGKNVHRNIIVPCYKANINPFISYFFQSASQFQFESIRKSSIAKIEIFFELKEVRDYFKTYFYLNSLKRFGLFDAFLRTLENELIENWIYFNERFNASLFLNLERYFLNLYILNNKKLEEELDYFIKSKTKTVEQREEIIYLFEKGWKELIRDPKFVGYINFRIKHEFPDFTQQMMQENAKIRFLAFLLFSESDLKIISESFLSDLTIKLIKNIERKPGTIQISGDKKFK